MPYKDYEVQLAWYRAWMRRRWMRRRRAWIQERGGRCEWPRCGSTQNLEIDHVDPTEKVYHTGSGFWTRREEVRRAELAKCQLLCRRHHEVKTTREAIAAAAEKRVHGTVLRYDVDGCRCAPCQEAHRAHLRARNAAYAQKVHCR